jgi:hypothetical protein
LIGGSVHGIHSRESTGRLQNIWLKSEPLKIFLHPKISLFTVIEPVGGIGVVITLFSLSLLLIQTNLKSLPLFLSPFPNEFAEIPSS